MDKFFDVATLVIVTNMGYKVTDFITMSDEKDYYKGEEVKKVIVDYVDVGRICNIFLKRGNYIYQMIPPHKGNGYKYILQRNYINTFDKWSNCENELEFKTEQELLKKMKRRAND